MTFKYIICEGDVTTHGGKVLEGIGVITIEGRKVALISHQVFCPKCGGNYSIIEGTNRMSFMGQNVALEGMKTACGGGIDCVAKTGESGSFPLKWRVQILRKTRPKF